MTPHGACGVPPPALVKEFLRQQQINPPERSRGKPGVPWEEREGRQVFSISLKQRHLKKYTKAGLESL